MSYNTRDKKPLKTYGIEWVAIPFSFIPNITASTSSPLVANVVGPVTVSWTATGVYHCALQGGYPQMVLPSVFMESALKGAYALDSQNVSGTGGTFQIRAYTGGTTTQVNFTATTSVQRVHGMVLVQASSYTR